MTLPRRVWLSLVVAGFLAFCAILRAPINVIPPLVARIGADMHLGTVALGALTSLPVLCYGIATPAASRLLRSTGANTGGLITLALIIVGALLRCVGPVWALFAGTIIMGVGITVGNLVAPMIIGRDFWHKTSTMTGLYSATCNVWVTACTALAVPLAGWIGWRGSATAWAVVPTLLALALWLWVYPPGLGRPRGTLLRASGMIHWVIEPRGPQAHTTRGEGADSPEQGSKPTTDSGTFQAQASTEPQPATREGEEARATVRGGVGNRGPVWKRPIVWLMALTFACHTFSYYAILGWLPTVLADLAGMSESGAGVASSVFSFTGIVGPLLVPVMFETLHWSGRRVLGVLSACWIALPLCLVVVPGAWLVPCVASGIAQGALFAALFTIVIQRAGSVDDNRQMTALIQTAGYIVAAVGPVAMGAMHVASGSWLVPFVVVVGVLLVMTVSGYVVAGPTREPVAGPARDMA